MAVNTDVHLANNISHQYDLIIGRDLMRELGMKLNFDSDTIELGKDLQIPMSDMDDLNEILFSTGIKEPPLAAESVECVSRILDTKYAAVTPEHILENSPHLTDSQKPSLKPILQKTIPFGVLLLFIYNRLNIVYPIKRHLSDSDPKSNQGSELSVA